jgi:hypothetical protein
LSLGLDVGVFVGDTVAPRIDGCGEIVGWAVGSGDGCSVGLREGEMLGVTVG